MNKTELSERLARKTSLTLAEAGRVVTALLGGDGIIAEALTAGEHVRIQGFGALEVRSRKARNGTNPSTGEPLRIEAKQVVRFKAGTTLADRLAG